MRETGLTEAKLVEMLDFMDEQGIIKLDYPKGGEQQLRRQAWLSAAARLMLLRRRSRRRRRRAASAR